MWQSIKSGAWFTPARARAYPLILLIAVVAVAAVWIALADNLVDRMQENKFLLIINLRTAKSLGIRISDNLLSLADEVIE